MPRKCGRTSTRHLARGYALPAARGTDRIVALSGLDADLSSPFCCAVSYGYTERLLAESGCLVSIARASVYSE
jgi:NAD(P)H dehydrogenase (quinone)